MRYKTLFALLALVPLSACIVDINSPQSGSACYTASSMNNAPAVSASSSGFSFAVCGIDFVFDDEYATSLQSSNLQLSVALSHYGSGMAKVEVRDATNAVVFTQQFTRTLSQNLADIHGSAPFRVRMTFSSFNGQFAANLGPQ